MNRLAKTLILTVAVFFAVISTSYALVTDTVAVTSVSVGGSGDVFIKTDGTFVNGGGCTNLTKYLIQSSHAARKELIAILLTAQAAEKSVVMAIAGCATIGAQTYSNVNNIEVK